MHEKHQSVNRVYIMLDKPFVKCIIEYKWSTTSIPWLFEKLVWNTWNETMIGNSLRDGKYELAVF